MSEVKDIQRTLNAFTSRYLKGVPDLIVDGDKGHATNTRIHTAQWYVGYGKGNLDSEWTSELVRRLRHPRSREHSTARMIAVGIKRRAAQKARWARTHVLSFLVPGVTKWEGVVVAKAAVYFLDEARKRGWTGVVNSGWRDPIFSRSLCIAMCGVPFCPGRCAGLSSNHVGNTPQRFAIDVSQYDVFGRIMREIPIPEGLVRIHNELGAQDPVHFSPSGR